MIGVLTARDGRVASGSGDVATHADECWLVGGGVADAELPLDVARRIELGPFATARWAAWLAAELPEGPVVLAATPDGRDLAAALAGARGVPLVSGCVDLDDARATVPRFGGGTTAVVPLPASFVATVQVTRRSGPAVVCTVPVERPELDGVGPLSLESGAATFDRQSADLAEAPRIVCGGAGLNEGDFAALAEVAVGLDAALGATRVVTDRGWLPPDRQIGTTGVTVSPDLYVAIGVSGAVQHTAGIGAPTHIVSVNTDAACPMSLLADLAVVADGPAVVAALRSRLAAR